MVPVAGPPQAGCCVTDAAGVPGVVGAVLIVIALEAAEVPQLFVAVTV